MNGQVKREETPQHDTSLFLKFQLRTDKPEAERLELAGVRRIMIELEGKPEMREFCRRYSNLVDSVADILKNDLKIKPHEEERFITETWGIMYGNLRMREVKIGAFLSQSLQTNEWDCDNSSFLIFDVAKKLGINAKIASVPRHVFIATDNFFFEITAKAGRYYPLDILEIAYPIIYGMTSDLEAVQSITYNTCGIAYAKQGLYEKAIAAFKKAIDLNKKDAQARNNLGVVYARQGFYEKAIAEYTEAIDLNPNFAEAYKNRGLNHLKLGHKEEAKKRLRNSA